VILDLIAALFVLAGLVFFLGCVTGLIRFPDFYTRMHAAGKGDTLSTVLVLTGFALFSFHDGVTLGSLLVAAKILGISAFIMLTSPASTHALMRAGYEDGVVPYEGPGQEEPDRKEGA
jgi:multicomponent Na+:H+ antiporter subunit G